MPVVAAAILQRIADFLAVGASPQRSSEGGEDFSQVLARSTTPLPADTAVPGGNDLPADRQDLAASVTELSLTELSQLDGSAPDPDATTPTPIDIPPSSHSPSTPTAAVPVEIPTILVTTAAPATATASANALAARANRSAQPAAPAATSQSSQQAARQAAVAPSVEQLLTAASVSAEAPITATTLSKPVVSTASKAPAVEAASTSAGISNPPADITVAISAEISPAAVAVPAIDALPTATNPIEIMASAESAPVALASPAEIATVDAAPAAMVQAASTQPAEPGHRHAKATLKDRGAVHTAAITAKPDAAVAETSPDITPTIATTASLPNVAIVPLASPTPAIAASLTASPEAGMTDRSSQHDAATVQPPLTGAVANGTTSVQSATASPALTPTPGETPNVAPAQSLAAAPVALPTAAQQASPTPASSDTSIAPAVIVATTPVSSPPASSLIFVATPQRRLATPAPAARSVDQTIAVATPDNITTAATTATPAAAAPSERDAAAFQPTAKLILASQPGANDAPRASDAETRTISAPTADTAPTLGQHLAAAHGSERPAIAAAPTPSAILSTANAAALVETIQMLRSEAKSDAMTLAVDHDELGRITMRFDRADHGVSVRFDSPDPTVTQLIANSVPALKSSGDGVGMRFERQDAAGSGAGTSRDAPRHGAGQDRNPTPQMPSQRARPGAERDGIFA